jgi:predicted ATP-dependent serine protease
MAVWNPKLERKYWCSTCGREVPVDQIECATCKKWWEDNPPPSDPEEFAEEQPDDPALHC